MNKYSVPAPKFSMSFFLPKYWLNWIGISILFLISWLPYRMQLWLGSLVGLLMYRLAKRRVNIARTNLSVCFPNMPEAEKEQLVRENFKASGIAIFESGMGWWWPSWRIKRKAHYQGMEHLDAAVAKGKGVLLVACHMVCLEMSGRILGQHRPNVAFYRPHNNALMEYFQYHGRARDNRYLIGKKDVKGLISALRHNESCIYLPDQDYGRRRSVFVPFFAEPEACTTTGTSLFSKQTGCTLLMVNQRRLPNGKGYEVKLEPISEHYPSDDESADATILNQIFERCIEQAPEQYMWLHRRFKTRPDPKQPSYYQ